MSISNAAEKLVDAVIETYFQLQDEPLPGWGRFLCAWAGAATLFGSMFVTGSGLRNLVQPFNDPSLDSFDKIWIVILTTVIAPLVPGFLIAAARTRHGPVRLYFSGLFFSVLVVAVTLGLWDKPYPPR